MELDPRRLNAAVALVAERLVAHDRSTH
jgi:hypothetical protein